ncbi:MAG: YbaK/EbsC family protein [Clostridia bacterium]|nr:YbaK/EbsC family protein [Clostridia bacterium]
MSIEKVREHLAEYGLDGRIIEFDVSSATVELAAAALGTEGARIAKSISLSDGDGCVLVVCAGDCKIDNRKFKDKFGFKPRMLSPDEALSLTGHAVGGVCPFALPARVRVFLDVSMQRFDTVYPAAGTASSAVSLSCEELYRASKAEEWVDVCKRREYE